LKPLSLSTATVLFGVISLVVAAHAAPITYEVTATGTGSLGGASFSNALVTLTLRGNTSTVTHPLRSTFNNTCPPTAAAAGIGTATVTNPIVVFSNEGIAVAGIEDTVNSDILDTSNAAFATYDLTTAIGPVTGPSLINSGTPFPTSVGNFILTAASDSTFTA